MIFALSTFGYNSEDYTQYKFEKEHVNAPNVDLINIYKIIMTTSNAYPGGSLPPTVNVPLTIGNVQPNWNSNGTQDADARNDERFAKLPN